jgi:2-polyprenyl-6-methoxyphenol hydroxylase-like FAD-dependent oxidoreductase
LDPKPDGQPPPLRRVSDVLIIGGGPVGMGLAIELGQRGVCCVVIERYPEPQRIPKGQNLTQRTVEHFHFWHAEAALRAARTIPKEYGIGGLTTYGALLGSYSYDWLQRDIVAQYYYTANERLPQYATERVLRDRASQLPAVDVLYGCAAEHVVQDEEGVTVQIRERDGTRTAMVRGKYLVGCDGSHSIIREASGITQTLAAHDRRMVLLVFQSHTLHELLARRFPGKSYFIVLHPDHAGYWQFVGRVDLEGTWFFHGPVPSGTTRDNFDFQRYVTNAVGADFTMDVQHLGFWDLRFAVADTYRAGRIFIAGDAAHSHPPYGGYGINMGLEDAVNLGWKLDAHLGRWGGPRLLDSYTEERQPVFASTSRDFIERAIHRDRDFVAAFSPDRDRAAFERAWEHRRDEARDEIDWFEPHYEGSSIVSGPPGTVSSAVGRHTFGARAGHHLAPCTLSSGRNVFQELGAGFTLLAFAADPAVVRTFADAAQRLGMPMKIIEDARSGDRERYDAALILVRPDQFVAFSGEHTNAEPVLRRAIGL